MTDGVATYDEESNVGFHRKLLAENSNDEILRKNRRSMTDGVATYDEGIERRF